MKYFVLFFIPCFMTITLFGCGVIDSNVPSKIQPIPQPPILNLNICPWSLPVLQNQWILREDKKWKDQRCGDYPKKFWDDAVFQSQCLRHAVDTQSEILVGYDEAGLACHNENWRKIEQQLNWYKEQVERINQQIEQSLKNQKKDGN